jgi:two-component system, OmpR family, response regulator
MRVLVVEDDVLVAAGLKQGLDNAGFTTDITGSAESAETFLQEESFDLAVVDIGLPKANGFTLVRRLRDKGLSLPVLFLTARDSVEDTVAGLNVGADDYIVKPFRLPELVARIRALVRRSNALASSELRHDGLILNVANRTVTMNGEELEITRREWSVLEALLMASPQVVSKEKLVQSLAGWDKDITPNAIEVHVSRLRAKLALGGVEIRTVRGIGYRIDRSSS